MEINDTIQNEIDKLTPQIIKDYGFRLRIEGINDTLISDEMGYVNIEYDDKFKVCENDFVFDIRNKKVIVTVWKNVTVRHITIL